MFSPPHYCCPAVHTKQCRYKTTGRTGCARSDIRSDGKDAIATTHAQLRSMCRNRGPHIGPTGAPGHVVLNARARGSREARPDRMDAAAGPKPHAIWSGRRPDDVTVTITRTGFSVSHTTYTMHGEAHETCGANENTFCGSHIIMRHIHSYDDNGDTIGNDRGNSGCTQREKRPPSPTKHGGCKKRIHMIV